LANHDFAEKLRLVLKLLTVSRTGLAHSLGVDKSLVGRWASGAVRPSEHNLARLTRFVADKTPGFSILDWERDIADFAAVFGAESFSQKSVNPWMPRLFEEEAARMASQRGQHYTGLWRSTRASHDLPGRFVHDLALITFGEDGIMRFTVGVEGVRYHGWSIMLQHQIFSMSFDHDACTAMFGIYNGVARQKPQLLDGLNLATLRDAGGSPAASASVLERIAEVSGDREADERMFEEAVSKLEPLAAEGSVPPDIAEHLTRNVHGEAAGILRLLYSQTLARGATLSELARSRKLGGA
jgi:transcriptional regulator with XRE-family HTH domain